MSWPEASALTSSSPGCPTSAECHLAIAFAAGGTAVITRTDGWELLFGLPFGVGAGLTADEIALLVDVDNPYWTSERFAIYQAAAAGLGAASLAARFILHGRQVDSS